MSDQLSKVVAEMRDCAKTRPDTPLSGLLTLWADRIESAAAPVEVGGDVSRAEYVAGAVAAAWCKHDLSVREHRCKEAATMIRTLARQLAEANSELTNLRAANIAYAGEVANLYGRAGLAESQLAEATRRLGEVEGLLREAAGHMKRGRAYYSEYHDFIERITALTKEPAK